MKKKQKDYSQLLLDYYSIKKQPDNEIDISLESYAKQQLPSKLKKNSKQFALSSS